jgi:hypothetical protein
VTVEEDGSSTPGDTATTTVTVSNVDPVIGVVNGPAVPQPINSTVTISATFSDVGTQDPHTCAINWDDGATTAGTVVETNGAGTCSGTHQYTASDVYTVTVTITDDDGGSDIELFRYVVIYPNSGFVTGGGWIWSPLGAYTADPTLEGKATFGFVSQYKKGATVPTGNTEFQFHAGDLNFKSSSFQWLVISGSRAQYKGLGTINGSGNYGFLVTAIDGQLSGGGGTDKFRIKIWDTSNGDAVVYDNQIAAAEDSSAATALSGGSIVIHK